MVTAESDRVLRSWPRVVSSITYIAALVVDGKIRHVNGGKPTQKLRCVIHGGR